MPLKLPHKKKKDNAPQQEAEATEQQSVKRGAGKKKDHTEAKHRLRNTAFALIVVVLLGVIGCVTVLPSLILLFDRPLQRTRHKALIRNANGFAKGITKAFPVMLVIFALLVYPALYGYQKTNDEVYYDMGQCLPQDIDYVIAHSKLADDFDIASTHMLLVDANLPSRDVRNMKREMEQVDGVKYVLSLESVVGSRVPEEVLPDSVRSILKSDRWELMLINSEYKVASDAVNDHVAARKLGWERYPELIRTLYAQLTESDYYKDYMQREERSFDDDKKLLEDFFKELQSCEALDDVLEEMSILWTDDLPYIVIMVLRTLSNLRVSHTELKVPAKFKSSEDPEFVKTLFEKSLVNYSAFQDYIEKFTANWDVERIVFMDNLIIGTAMAELTSFPSIPVKVTLDEYIEISKYYSTPGSSTFINGVLDKIVESLTAEGRIKKAGRGLI